MVDFSRRIKLMRLAQGLTQEELAKRAGIRQSHLSAVERGVKKGVTIETLRKVAKGLRCKVGELVDQDCEGCGGC